MLQFIILDISVVVNFDKYYIQQLLTLLAYSQYSQMNSTRVTKFSDEFEYSIFTDEFDTRHENRRINLH